MDAAGIERRGPYRTPCGESTRAHDECPRVNRPGRDRADQRLRDRGRLAQEATIGADGLGERAGREQRQLARGGGAERTQRLTHSHAGATHELAALERQPERAAVADLVRDLAARAAAIE